MTEFPRELIEEMAERITQAMTRTTQETGIVPTRLLCLPDDHDVLWRAILLAGLPLQLEVHPDLPNGHWRLLPPGIKT